MLEDARLGLENLAHRQWMLARALRELGGQRWFWRLSLALAFEGLTGPPHRVALPAGWSAEDALYGETPPWTAWKLLGWAELQADKQVLEVGCGRGICCLVASLVWGAQSRGIEVVPGRAAKARALARSLDVPLTIEARALQPGDVPGSDLILLSATSWSDSNWLQVVDGLKGATHGTRALSISRPIPGWTVLGEQNYPFSWGWARCWLQLRP